MTNEPALETAFDNHPKQLPARIVTVTLEMITEDGEAHAISFNLNPVEFKISQHRSLEPVFGPDGRTLSFKEGPAWLTIRGTTIPDNIG